MRILILFLLLGHTLFAQLNEQCTINVHIRFGQSDLQVGDTCYPIFQTDSLRLEAVKFYMAGIELWKDNKRVWAEPNSFHLIDATEPASMKIKLPISNAIQYNQLKFSIGIDSATNTAGAMGGDLDPTKGMYWTWQSGYINVKIEGTYSRSTARNKKFQFHIGGYKYPYAAVQPISLPVQSNSGIHLALNLEQLLERLFTDNQFEIMSPCQEAVRVSQQMASLFTLMNP